MLIGPVDMFAATGASAAAGAVASNDGASLAQAPTSPNVRNTLWQGELEPWMDEAFLRQLWGSYCGEQVGVKLVRNKLNNGQGNSAFIEFSGHEMAARCLQQLNGHPLPNSHTLFRLNWAGASTSNYGSRPTDGPEFSLFVGDLGREVNDYLLFSTFHQRYPTCKTAKVVVDPVTNNSKGYGFVRFSDESDCYRAMHELNGQYCGSRPMRISAATPRTPRFAGTFGGANEWNAQNGAYAQSATMQAQFQPPHLQQPQQHQQHMAQHPQQHPQQQHQQQQAQQMYAPQHQQQQQHALQHQHHVNPMQHHSMHMQQQPSSGPKMAAAPLPPTSAAMPGSADPSNAKVFVGGLAAHVTEEELRAYFAPYGEIIYVKIPAGKGCGFVHYGHKSAADKAIAALNGVPIGGSPVRLSWARTAADKQRLLQHVAAPSPLSAPLSVATMNGSVGTSSGAGSPPNGFAPVTPLSSLYYDGAFAPVELMNGGSNATSAPGSGRVSPNHGGFGGFASTREFGQGPPSAMFNGLTDPYASQYDDMNAEFSRRFGGDADGNGAGADNEAGKDRWRFGAFSGTPTSQLFA